MLGLLIIFVLVAIGFAAGYATRELISRKRYAEYLRFQPYTSPALRSRRSSPEVSTRTRHAASESQMAESRRPNDITRSFQDLSMHESKPPKSAGAPGANLHLVQKDRPQPEPEYFQAVDVEQSLEELVALLERRTREG
jgi:hypothetical protein